MNLKNLKYGVSQKIATITIDRPKVLNALNSETISEIATAVDEAIQDEKVSAVILTGGCEKSFIAGVDIGELTTHNATSGRSFALFGQEVLNRIEGSSKPFVAAVNGFALGGGCEVALACHIRIAASTAHFGQPEVGLGLIPGYGGTQRLPRLVGKGIALELLLSGSNISSEEAHRIGLVNKVIEALKKDDNGDLLLDFRGKPQLDKVLFMAEVVKFTQNILGNAPLAIASIIEAVNRGLEGDLATGLKLEADLFGRICITEDMREGTKAFIEKRKPKFKGV